MKRAILVALLTPFALGVVVSAAWMQSDRAEAAREARQLLDDFFEAFNEGDNAALHEITHFPHFFIFANGEVNIAEEPEELMMPFEAMRANEGWHHSTLDEVNVCQISEEKVHFEIVFSRFHEDGTRYRTVPALWVVSKIDGKWGIQSRSLMRPTFEE